MVDHRGEQIAVHRPLDGAHPLYDRGQLFVLAFQIRELLFAIWKIERSHTSSLREYTVFRQIPLYKWIDLRYNHIMDLRNNL